MIGHAAIEDATAAMKGSTNIELGATGGVVVEKRTSGPPLGSGGGPVPLQAPPR
jgi:hypothetical protein